MTAGLYTPAFHSVWSIVCAYALGGLPYGAIPDTKSPVLDTSSLLF